MVLRSGRCLNQVGGNFESKSRSLQVVLPNHGRDLVLNLLHVLRKLLAVPSRKSLQAFQCVELQLPL